MNVINEMTLIFRAVSENEGFARSAVAAFCVQINPTLDEITDIKTAVSEAVTNSVVHAYPKEKGEVVINVKLTIDSAIISVSDTGIGISDVEKVRQPFFTTKPDQERSGMGFTVMESFMDKVNILKNKGKGVTILMEKKFGGSEKKAIGE